jgi:tripartite-type tricarboxylate transporter receptor subunit TctC
MVRSLVFAAAVAIAALSSQWTCALADASAWPDHPVHLVVPFPAGSSTDTIARIVGQMLAQRLGQQIVVDNRPGASGDLGAEAVAHAAPDGYTIGIATTSTHALAVSLSAHLPYDPVKDFSPVAMIGDSPYVLAVYPGLPAKSVAELIALAKEKPRALNYASAGSASLAHLAGALFEKMAGVELTHVPYRSSAQSVLDLVEGRIEMQFGQLAPTLPFLTSGKMRALAVTGARRIDALPDLPTVAENGLPGYEVSLWMAIVGPAGVPQPIIERLSREVAAVVNSPDGAAALKAQLFVPGASTPEALQTVIRDEIVKWRDVANAAGIKPE